MCSLHPARSRWKRGNTQFPLCYTLPSRRTTRIHGFTGNCETAYTYLFLWKLLLNYCLPTLWLFEKKRKPFVQGGSQKLCTSGQHQLLCPARQPQGQGTVFNSYPSSLLATSSSSFQFNTLTLRLALLQNMQTTEGSSAYPPCEEANVGVLVLT